MAQWVPKPELDSGSVGLGFIAIGYGVVLVAVFPGESATLPHTGVAGLFHFALAALLLATSWVGYYTNRQQYPVWTVRCFNVPLVQYFISFSILLAYWELGITVEKPGPYLVPTPRSEAFIVLLVFIAYLAWDFLEIIVQESDKYAMTLILHDRVASCPPRIERVYRRLPGHAVPVGKFGAERSGWFAKDLRGGRLVTFVFVIGYGIGLWVVLHHHLQRTTPVAVVDGIYIVSLFAYRYLQWWWPTWWYRVLSAPVSVEPPG